MLRVDVGNPMFGNVTAVFAPGVFSDAIVAAPIDSGLYTMFCNQSYMHQPGAQLPHFNPQLSCSHDITAGTPGAIDHVLLNNAMFWERRTDTLARYFARSCADGTRTAAHAWRQVNGDSNAPADVNTSELITYIEPNIIANALYADQAVKMLVGAFAPLFGTVRGALLRRWAQERRIVLTWALGDGMVDSNDGKGNSSVTFAGDLRVVDVPTSSGLINATTSAADHRAFQSWWDAVAAARNPATGGLAPTDVVRLWAKGYLSLPTSVLLAVPRAYDCANWTSCLGRSRQGRCVCKV